MIDTQHDSQPYWRRAYIHNFFVDKLLTEALHNPLLLRNEKIFADYSHRFSLNLPESYGARETIVVQQVHDKTKIARLLIILLTVSPALGLLVGFVSSNPEIGVAVSAGVFALASLLQGLAAWFQN